VFDGRLLSPGAHVNAIGAYQPNSRQLDDATVTRGRVFVEDRSAALSEAGDLVIPVKAGCLDPAAVAGDLFGLCSGAVGRVDSDEITIVKSVGLAVDDLAIADALLEALQDRVTAGV
jgi:ornithine cyclodeaminase